MKEWHKIARKMRETGFSYGAIAKATGYTPAGVRNAVKGVVCPKSPSELNSEAKKGVPHKNRRNERKISGFKMGTLNRVAINFTEEQFLYLVNIKNSTGNSFSKVVSDIVQRGMK